MRRVTQWLLMGFWVVCGLPGAAQASEMDILLEKLVARGVLTSADASDVRAEVKKEQATASTQVAKEALPDSSRNWKWSGDLRLREEFRNQTGSGADLNRERIRLRYGFDAKVADGLRVGARLATGTTTNPVATNQSFDVSFNKVNFLLDRAFVEYSPEFAGLDEFHVSGGIIENPFWTVGQLVWDDDLNFDGAAVHLAKAVGPLALFTNDGVFSLQTDISEAAALWSTQGGLSLKPFADAGEEVLKNLKVTGAVAYHDYQNVTHPLSESSALATAGGLKGNTSGIADVNILNPSFELASRYRDVPVGLFGDFVHNTALASSNNNGFALGVRAGKAQVPFDLRKGWEAGYAFERLEPDATLGAFTDSDFGNGGTNHRGNTWWVKLAVLKDSTLQFKYMSTEELKGAKNHVDTMQADWSTKF